MLWIAFVALQRNADDVKSSESLVEFSQRLITEDMSQQMFTYAFVFWPIARSYILRHVLNDLFCENYISAVSCILCAV